MLISSMISEKAVTAFGCFSRHALDFGMYSSTNRVSTLLRFRNRAFSFVWHGAGKLLQGIRLKAYGGVGSETYSRESEPRRA